MGQWPEWGADLDPGGFFGGKGEGRGPLSQNQALLPPSLVLPPLPFVPPDFSKTPHPCSFSQTLFRLGFLEAKEAERPVPWVGEQLQSKKLSGRPSH